MASVEFRVLSNRSQYLFDYGVATLRGTDGGKRYEVRLRFADIWAKRGGKWKVIYTQVASAP